MNARQLGALLTLLALSAPLGACEHKDSPTAPQNRPPVISSITVFPQTIGPGDSAIVFCDAFDPDGDSLFYDWTTDAHLKIKDAPLVVFLFGSRSPSQVFYYSSARAPLDTVRIGCTVRDNKSGNDVRTFYLYMHP